jgi:hypothetical protein
MSLVRTYGSVRVIAYFGGMKALAAINNTITFVNGIFSALSSFCISF